MIILTLRFQPPVERMQGILAMLEASRPVAEGSAGCLEFSVTVEPSPEGAVHIRERWESEDDVRRHCRSNCFRRMLELMERSEAPPDFQVYKVLEASGLEFVEGARQDP